MYRLMVNVIGSMLVASWSSMVLSLLEHRALLPITLTPPMQWGLIGLIGCALSYVLPHLWASWMCHPLLRSVHGRGGALWVSRLSGTVLGIILMSGRMGA